MANTTVNLYIDDTSLRMMVTQGKQIKEWAESPLEPGMVEDNIILKEAEVAARIKQLFEFQKVKTKTVNLGISGFRCLTRPITLPRLPKEMVDEAVRREFQRVLAERAVPLDELYLSWQLVPSPAEQTRVFLVGIPRKMADVLVKVLQQAGLRVGFMQIKPLLLARVVEETRAIIIDVQATEFIIVVMADDVLHPVRSVRFATGALSKEEKLATIKNELNRSLSFYSTTYPEKPLAANVPVFTSGDLTNDPELYQSLSTEFGHPFLPLPSPLECPEGLDSSHYMANIGLALHVTSAKEKSGTTPFTLNALPVAYQYKAVSLANVLVLPGAAVAISLLVFLYLFSQSVSADITSINTQLSKTSQLLLQRQIQQKQLSGNVTALQNKLSAITASRDGLTSVFEVLEKQATSTDRDLSAAMDALPQSMSLSRIHHISNVLTVTGKSPDEKQVSYYIARLSDAKTLDGAPLFGDNITVTEMVRNESNGVDFTLVGTTKEQTIGASSTEVALGSLPAGVSLTNVKSDKGILALEGIAPNADKVFSYLRALEASGKFTEITATSMARSETGNMTMLATGNMSFSLVLKTGE